MLFLHKPTKLSKASYELPNFIFLLGVSVAYESHRHTTKLLQGYAFFNISFRLLRDVKNMFTCHCKAQCREGRKSENKPCRNGKIS